jgi:hypothetical protein
MTLWQRILIMVNSVPFFLFICAVLLFIAGYLSNIFWGPDQFMEESAEYFLRNHFGTDVEFSPNERARGKE